MALLAAASELRDAREWTLVVGHLDHGLRSGSADDAALVRTAADERGIPFRGARVDIAAFARERRLSIEEAGREARYRFLDELAGEYGAETLVVTAHTADDSAETVLLNLARGSGVAGLRGIPVRRGRIVRPLLAVRRRDIRAWVVDAAIPFREDESNRDTRFARNRVRAELMPVVERLNPAAVDAVLRLARLAGDDDDVLTATAAAELARRRLAGDALQLDWRRPPPRAIGRRVIRLALGAAPSLGRVEALLDAAEGPAGGQRIQLGAGWLAAVRGRVISFSRSED